MDLKFELPPGVFAQLYRQCTAWMADGRLTSFDERREELSIDDEWLAYAVRRYDAMERAGYGAVGASHGSLASWLLAGEIGSGESAAQFEAELRPQLSDVTGAEEFILIAWVVGRQVGLAHWGHRVIAIPSPRVSAQDVALAYEGLVEHAANFADSPPFRELARTSLVTRLAGLVDGITQSLEMDKKEGIAYRLSKLVKRVESSLGPLDRRRCEQTTKEFEHHRNVLVHVHADEVDRRSGRSFSDYAALFDDDDELANRVCTATVVVFGEVAIELQRVDGLSMRGLLNAVDAELQAAAWAESF